MATALCIPFSKPLESIVTDQWSDELAQRNKIKFTEDVPQITAQ